MNFEKIALENVSRPEDQSLVPAVAPKPGDVVAFYSRGSVRTGVVTKVGRVNAQVLYATEGGIRQSVEIHSNYSHANAKYQGDLAAAQAADNYDWYKGMAEGTYDWSFPYDPAEYVAKLAACGEREAFIEAAREQRIADVEARRAEAKRLGPYGYVHYTTKSVKINTLGRIA